MWVFALLGLSLLVATTQADETGVRADRYVFSPEQSTIEQTGGFAGVHWTYSVEGQFCLTVDSDAGTARFEQVDANAVDVSEPARTLDPNAVFNLTALAGVIANDAIEFTGQTADGSTVGLTVTLTDDTVRLTGRTTPPPNSADFFLFAIDALAARKYAGGTGDPNTPYQIATAEQMNAIGTHPEDWDKHFQLTADIDLSAFDGKDGRPAFNIIAPEVRGEGVWYFPGVPFSGVLDGNGHVVANFTYTCQNTDHVGLFGCVAGPGGAIRNLGLVDPNVSAGNGIRIGAMVGVLWGGVADRCFVQGGSVSGHAHVGGLIGRAYDESMVANCTSATCVSASRNVGGLLGYNEGTIIDCQAAANIIGDEIVGGLVGLNDSFGDGLICSYCTGRVTGNVDVGGLSGVNGSVIHNCYSTASVAGESSVGGLVGRNAGGRAARSGNSSIILNCYSTGKVLGATDTGGLVGINHKSIHNCFWDIETSGWETSAGGMGRTSAEMRTSSTFMAWGACGYEGAWKIDEGHDYPRLCRETGPGQVLPVTRLGDFLEGTGTEDAPFLVYTGDDLALIGSFPCEWNRHFRLMADIDISGHSEVTHDPIGSFGIPFTGVFEGDAHAIRGFRYIMINRSCVGLFGCVTDPNARIMNLGLVDPEIGAGDAAYVGAIVGYCADATVVGCFVEGGHISGGEATGGLIGACQATSVTDCHASIDVSGSDNAGGLVGYNSYSRIADCHATGIVSGADNVGGLIGYSIYAEIARCYARGNTTGVAAVGGLTGRNEVTTTITDCHASGDVSGRGYVGGVAGYNDWTTIRGCRASGEVSGDSRVGGFAGYSDHIIQECCATGSVSGRALAGGFIGLGARAILDCYASGATRGSRYVGGFVGAAAGDIIDCYATGTTLGEQDTGGFAGFPFSTNPDIWASFWDVETSGQLTSVGGKGLTTAEMQTAATYLDAGWDFVGETANGTDDLWWIDEGQGYPRLWWEIAETVK